MIKYIICFILSYVITSIIFYRKKSVESNVGDYLTHMSFEHFNTIDYKNSFFEELEVSIIYRSGIRSFFPSINLKKFISFILLIFMICFTVFLYLTELIFPSVIISMIVSFIPFIIVNVMEQRKNDLVSKELTRFISVISKWAVVKDDIFYCFEKSLDQIEDPIKSYINDFLMNVRYTGNISYAFDILILQSKNEMYRNFVINIRQAERSKGSLPLLLDYIEEEVYKIESENSRRKSVTLRDRTIVYITMLGVLLIGMFILKFNPGISEFYLDTTIGKYLLTLYLVLFFLGTLVASKITTFDY